MKEGEEEKRWPPRSSKLSARFAIGNAFLLPDCFSGARAIEWRPGHSRKIHTKGLWGPKAVENTVRSDSIVMAVLGRGANSSQLHHSKIVTSLQALCIDMEPEIRRSYFCPLFVCFARLRRQQRKPQKTKDVVVSADRKLSGNNRVIPREPPSLTDSGRFVLVVVLAN